MAKDEREEEREFLEGLKTRTGRDLARWLADIAAKGFSDKNEIIDWLRTQGLPFARAAWLERIHRNGGRPIFAGEPSGAAATIGCADARPAEGAPRRAPPPLRVVATGEATVEPEVAGKTEQAAAGGDADLEKLVAAAKGYRPLYRLLEAHIHRAVPGATFSAQARYISVGAPREFAAIALSAGGVRLGLDLGERAFAGRLEKAKLRGPGPAITHMIVLTDARQVDGDLAALLAGANARINPSSG
jgi:hypothetical protein